LGNTCKNTNECVAGLFCNATIGKCQAQVSKGANCTVSEQCLNYQFCLFNDTNTITNGVCTNYGSVAYGMPVNTDLTKETPELVCATASLVPVNSSVSFCGYVDYFDYTAQNVDSDGFVKCNYEDLCFYTDGSSKDCECGYNAAGQGYCPMAPARKQSKFNTYATTLAASYNNTCHTSHRSGVCSQTTYVGFALQATDAYKKSVTSNKYVDAVSCMAVSSSGFIQSSILAIILLLAFIF